MTQEVSATVLLTETDIRVLTSQYLNRKFPSNFISQTLYYTTPGLRISLIVLSLHIEQQLSKS